LQRSGGLCRQPFCDHASGDEKDERTEGGDRGPEHAANVSALDEPQASGARVSGERRA
jgi:hypothetical protein